MKRDPIDIVLQLAYLDGRISTRGLIEKSVMKGTPPVKIPVRRTEKLLGQLEDIVDERKTLQATKGAITLGEYITEELAGRPRRPESVLLVSIARKAGMAVSQLTRLCRDTLSPLEIPVKSMNALLRHFALPLGAAERLLRNSIRCAAMSPSLSSTLARYDNRDHRGKSKVMQKAVRELFVKSRIQITEDQQERINDYVRHATDGLEP